MSVLKRGGSYELSAVETLIAKHLKILKTPSTVGDLIEQLRTQYGVPESITLKALRRLQEANQVEWEHPEPTVEKTHLVTPTTLRGSQWLLRTSTGKETILTMILLGIGFLTIFVLPAIIPGGVPLLQIPLGFAIVLFFPGFALTSILLPEHLEFLNFERIILSFGFSLVLVPIISIGLNFTVWGITTESITLSLILFTLVGLIIAALRKYKMEATMIHPKNISQNAVETNSKED